MSISDFLTPNLTWRSLEFAPKKDTVDTVIEWLRAAGLDVHHHKHYDHWKGAVIVNMPIYEAEKLRQYIFRPLVLA